jgi:hypothetical protein
MLVHDIQDRIEHKSCVSAELEMHHAMNATRPFADAALGHR